MYCKLVSPILQALDDEVIQYLVIVGLDIFLAAHLQQTVHNGIDLLPMLYIRKSICSDGSSSDPDELFGYQWDLLNKHCKFHLCRKHRS